jgi:tRNA A37 N6-isopentenylltransferase MiaA
MLDRFATPEIAATAVRESKEDSIRTLGWRILYEMQEKGDPFAAEFLRELVRERAAKIDELLRPQKRISEISNEDNPLPKSSLAFRV